MIINVKVIPSAKEESCEKLPSGGFLVHTKAPPDKGKANLQVTRILARELQVPISKIHIKNPSSRKKLVYISD